MDDGAKLHTAMAIQRIRNSCRKRLFTAKERLLAGPSNPLTAPDYVAAAASWTCFDGRQ